MYFDEADEGAAAIVKPADAPMRAVISASMAFALLVLGLTWGPLYDWCALARHRVIPLTLSIQKGLRNRSTIRKTSFL